MLSKLLHPERQSPLYRSAQASHVTAIQSRVIPVNERLSISSGVRGIAITISCIAIGVSVISKRTIFSLMERASAISTLATRRVPSRIVSLVKPESLSRRYAMGNEVPQKNSLHFCPECKRVLIWIDGDSFCDNVDCSADTFPNEDDYRE
jgi:hypothetical protein